MRIATLLFLIVAVGHAQDHSLRPIAIVGGTVIDVSAFGASTHDIRDAVVIVERGRITAVGTRQTTKVPRGAEIIDAAGKFIVPGLTDAFATIDNQAFANAYLYMGVTTVIANEATNGQRAPLFTTGVPSPRIYKVATFQGYDATGLATPPRTLAELLAQGRRMDLAELNRHVDDLARSGVKVLLLQYTLYPDQLRSVAAHARAIGLGTIGELGETTYQEAIAAGVMAFVHSARYSLELAPPDVRASVAAAPFGPPRIPYYESLTSIKDDDPALARYAATLGTSGVTLIPTLTLGYLDLPGHRNPWNEPVAKLLDPADLTVPADRATGERPVTSNPRDRFPPGFSERLLGIESRYCRAGARYVAGSGTDAFGTMPGISLEMELELLVNACLTPRQALAAATANVGATFGWRDVGQIRAGDNADLLVLDADPTKDITNVKRINRLMLAGAMIDRAALLR